MKSFLKGLLELGRIIALGIVSYLLTEGVIDAILLAFDIKLTIEQKLVVTGLVTSILKAVDKWLHEIGQATKNLFLTKGITRF